MINPVRLLGNRGPFVTIGVSGAGTCDGESAESASEVGRCIAESGAVLVCGGRGGIMEAAAKGASEAGGITMGILPGDNALSGNTYLDIVIPTDFGHGRNYLLVRASQALVALPGSWGTLSEIALAIKSGIPVIGLNTWELKLGIIWAGSPEDAVNMAMTEIQKRYGSRRSE